MKLTVRGNCPAGSRLRRQAPGLLQPADDTLGRQQHDLRLRQEIEGVGPIGPEASISVPVSAMPATA